MGANYTKAQADAIRRYREKHDLLNLTLSSEDGRLLDFIADSEGMTRAEAVRIMIHEHALYNEYKEKMEGLKEGGKGE